MFSRYSTGNGQNIIKPNRQQEIKILADPKSASTWQLGANDRGNEGGTQHTVNDNILEGCLSCKFWVDMQWVNVPCQMHKALNVGFGDLCK